MNAPAYSFDKQAAIESESNRIDSSGKYIGVFAKVKSIVASTGAKGIEFSFKSLTGQEANYLTIYTHNRNGEPIYGFKQLMAIMACIGVRDISPEVANVTERDFSQNKDVQRQVELYPALMNQPIGLILQKELYTKNDNSDGSRMGMVGFFEAETGRTAKERLEDSPAKTIDAMMASLEDKDSRQNLGAAPHTGNRPADNGPAHSPGFDEIPF